jgi:hypothetical protein
METDSATPSQRRMSKLLVGMMFTLSIPATAHSVAQEQPTPAPQVAKTIKLASLEHQYWHLLRWQNHLDKVAAEHEKQGKDGTWLSNYIQKKLNFTDDEFAPIRASAQRLEPKTDAIQARSEAVMKADRALRAKGQLVRTDASPGQPQLQALSQERESAISDEIETLNRDLGPANAAKFKSFVEQQYAPPKPVMVPRTQPIKLHQGHEKLPVQAVQP